MTIIKNNQFTVELDGKEKDIICKAYNIVCQMVDLLESADNIHNIELEDGSENSTDKCIYNLTDKCWILDHLLY